MKLYNKFYKQLDDIASKKKFTIQFEIPDQSISRVIGKGGDVIKSIRYISGAEIDIDSSSAIVTITAEDSDSLKIAEELINEVISNPTIATLEMKKATIDMEIPDQSIKHVIGKDGNVIKRIRNISGAEIDFYSSTAIVNMTAETYDSVRIAKELINKVISNPTKATLDMKKLPNYKIN